MALGYRVFLGLWLIMAVLVPTSAQGVEAGGDAAAEANSYWQDHFSLHGYVTLGYAQADFGLEGTPTADEVMLGIEEGGTFPYGNAALNLRYDPAPRHSLILQLAAAELGVSPTDDVEGDPELDWLFYQFEPTQHTRLRLGRQPVPVGIFNEIRDAGVILPFFRPAYVFYREGAVLSETVDGISVSHDFFSTSPWTLDATVYYGEFDVLRQGLGFQTDVVENAAEEALGSQLWLGTPASGLRVGAGFMNWNVPDPEVADNKSEWRSWQASAEYLLDRWVLRGEYRRTEVEFFTGSSRTFALDYTAYYLQLGRRFGSRLTLYLQSEHADGQQISDLYVGGSEDFKDRRDLGVSVTYEFSPNLVLKAEHHQVEAEVAVDSDILLGGPLGFQQRSIFRTLDSTYSILSVAVSF